jgi:hypothetical protein
MTQREIAAMEGASGRPRDMLREGPRLLPTSSLGAFADLAFEDFQLRLRALNRTLAGAVNQLASSHGERATPIPCMTHDDAQRQLAILDALAAGQAALQPFIALTDGESAQQERLRRCALEIGHSLPLDRLAEDLDLQRFEVDVIVLCAAAELDRAYGRLFGFIVDNLNRQAPSIELACTLGRPDARERLARRRALGPQARLRRCGLVVATENGERPLDTTLCLPPSVFHRLTHPGPWSDRFFDPDLVDDDSPSFELFPDGEALRALAAGMRQGRIEVCALWGTRERGVAAAVTALAGAANRPLFRVPTAIATIDAALAAAEDRHGMLWVPADALSDASAENLREIIAARLARSALPVCLSGEYPWRPTSLLAVRNYVELRMAPAPWPFRKRLWRDMFPELEESRAEDVAARFRLGPREMQAVYRVARAGGIVGRNPVASAVSARLDDACMQITQRQGMRFTRLVEPKRGPDDLVLPQILHQQVLEIARFYRMVMRVDDEWGFQRIATGGGGVKALFTGDSGTGKTLAAEVIAGQLGLGLMVIDLSQLVSKWVGETEKNLECAFREAEDSHAVLFFDEADTLCGKRGEIRSGTDRYANLEVGFLLQRLEQYAGLAILATNLSDEMDQAFVRRFQVVLHFPRPREDERRRLWRLAFPAKAPLDDGIDFDALVTLDMTGAGIAGAARMAAFLAADEASDRIRECHLREGIRRQFVQEARLFNEEVLDRRHDLRIKRR